MSQFELKRFDFTENLPNGTGTALANTRASEGITESRKVNWSRNAKTSKGQVRLIKSEFWERAEMLGGESSSVGTKTYRSFFINFLRRVARQLLEPVFEQRVWSLKIRNGCLDFLLIGWTFINVNLTFHKRAFNFWFSFLLPEFYICKIPALILLLVH